MNNSSSVFWQEWMRFNSTNSSHEHVSLSGRGDGLPYVERSLTIINDSLCLISIIVCLIIIFKYYVPIKTIIKPVKYCSILATTFWMLSNILWVINWHYETLLITSTMIVDEYPNEIFWYSLIFAQYTQGMGYMFFSLSFYFRIIHSFKESIFEISSCCQIKVVCSFVLFCIMFTVVVILRAKCLYTCSVITTIHTIFGLFSSIMYIIGSIIGVRIMITKLFQFKQLIQSVSIATYASSHMHIQSNHDSNSQTIKALYKIIKKISVLYLFALLSTISVICLLIVFLIITMAVDGARINWSSGDLVITIVYSYRTLVVIDCILNTICLFLQNDIANPLYQKYCHVCDRNITKCCCCCKCYINNTNNEQFDNNLSFNVAVT